MPKCVVALYTRIFEPTISRIENIHSFHSDNFFTTFIPELLKNPISENFIKIGTLIKIDSIVKPPRGENQYIILGSSKLPHKFTLSFGGETLTFRSDIDRKAKFWRKIRYMTPEEYNMLKTNLIREINDKFEKPDGEVTIHLASTVVISGMESTLWHPTTYWHNTIVATNRETKEVVGLLPLGTTNHSEMVIWYNANIDSYSIPKTTGLVKRLGRHLAKLSDSCLKDNS